MGWRGEFQANPGVIFNEVFFLVNFDLKKVNIGLKVAILYSCLMLHKSHRTNVNAPDVLNADVWM